MVEIAWISDSNQDAVSEAIEARLLASLAETSEQSNNGSFVLAIHDDAGGLIGGLTGRTSYGWLLIKTLWVDAQYRRTGLGSRLVSEGENRGQALGCHSAWLDTSNQQAYEFYTALGYDVFGEISNRDGQSPLGHKRWFMKKPL